MLAPHDPLDHVTQTTIFLWNIYVILNNIIQRTPDDSLLYYNQVCHFHTEFRSFYNFFAAYHYEGMMESMRVYSAFLYKVGALFSLINEARTCGLFDEFLKIHSDALIEHKNQINQYQDELKQLYSEYEILIKHDISRVLDIDAFMFYLD